MKESPHPLLRIFFLVFGTVVAFLALRMVLVKPFLFGTLILLFALAYLGYYFYQRVQRRRAEAAYATSAEGMIEERLAECRRQLARNREELASIDESIRQLNQNLQVEADALPRTWAESQRLLASFEEERALRENKIRFYEQCIAKLQRLRQNHELAATLETQHRKLKALQERHLDELADLENLRTSLEYEQRYLETIDDLSVRMLQSESLRDATLLNQELTRMRRPPGEGEEGKGDGLIR